MQGRFGLVVSNQWSVVRARLTKQSNVAKPSSLNNAVKLRGFKYQQLESLCYASLKT